MKADWTYWASYICTPTSLCWLVLSLNTLEKKLCEYIKEHNVKAKQLAKMKNDLKGTDGLESEEKSKLQ